MNNNNAADANRLLSPKEVEDIRAKQKLVQEASIPSLLAWAQTKIRAEMKNGESCCYFCQREITEQTNDFVSTDSNPLYALGMEGNIKIPPLDLHHFLPLLADHITANTEWDATYTFMGWVTLVPKKTKIESLWCRLKKWAT